MCAQRARKFLDQPGGAGLATLEPEELAARRQPADGVQLLERPRQVDPVVLAATFGLGGTGGKELEPRPLVVHRPGFLAIGHAANSQQKSSGAVVAGRLRRGQAVEQERCVRDRGQGVLLQEHRPGLIAGKSAPRDKAQSNVGSHINGGCPLWHMPGQRLPDQLAQLRRGWLVLSMDDGLKPPGNGILDRLGRAQIHHPRRLALGEHEADIAWRSPLALPSLDLGVLLEADESQEIEDAHALGQDLQQVVVSALMEGCAPGKVGNSRGQLAFHSLLLGAELFEHSPPLRVVASVCTRENQPSQPGSYITPRFDGPLNRWEAGGFPDRRCLAIAEDLGQG